MQQLIINKISKYINLSEREKHLFCDQLQHVSYKRKQYLVKDGDVSTSAAFVINGCMRAYSIDRNGFEHILQFAPSDWWITDMYSFVTQKPGSLFIDAVEETKALLLTREKQLWLFNEIPSLERYFRILTENSLVSSRMRMMDNLSLTAKERYDTFCHYYPTLIHTLSQKMIASYIGVTPEFLSKMKSEQVKGKKS